MVALSATIRSVSAATPLVPGGELRGGELLVGMGGDGEGPVVRPLDLQGEQADGTEVVRRGARGALHNRDLATVRGGDGPIDRQVLVTGDDRVDTDEIGGERLRVRVVRQADDDVGAGGAQRGGGLVRGGDRVGEREPGHVLSRRGRVEAGVDHAEDAHLDPLAGRLAVLALEIDGLQQVRLGEVGLARLGVHHVGCEHGEGAGRVQLEQAVRPVAPIVVARRRGVEPGGVEQLRDAVALRHRGERGAVEGVAGVQGERDALRIRQALDRREGVHAVDLVAAVDIVHMQDVDRADRLRVRRESGLGQTAERRGGEGDREGRPPREARRPVQDAMRSHGIPSPNAPPARPGPRRGVFKSSTQLNKCTGTRCDLQAGRPAGRGGGPQGRAAERRAGDQVSKCNRCPP